MKIIKCILLICVLYGLVNSKIAQNKDQHKSKQKQLQKQNKKFSQVFERDSKFLLQARTDLVNYKYSNFAENECFRYLNKYEYQPIENYFYVQYEVISQIFQILKEEYDDEKYSDYSNFQIPFGIKQDYDQKQKLGEGAYSVVYKGTNSDTQQNIIMKYYHKDEKLEQIKKEYKIQDILKEAPFTQQIQDSFSNSSSQYPYCLVYNYIGQDTLDTITYTATLLDIKMYMYKLTKSVAYAHSKDIKPTNVVINTDTNELNVIDWGSSEFLTSKRKVKAAGTHYFAPPEILMDYDCFDFTVDSWSIGTVLGALLFKRDLMFSDIGLDSVKGSILADIMRFNDEKDFQRIMWKFNMKMGPILQDQYDSIRNKWLQDTDKKKISFVEAFGKNERVGKNGLDLLKQLLNIDFSKRISPEQAMQHEFFQEVRDLIN